MENPPVPSDLILVALMPNRRDFDIARLFGWYRIPLRTAPKVVAVDWLAFYQPATFGDDHKWCIEYLAPVTGHELATRIDLFKEEPDHPRALEEYFKIQIGPMVSLPRPIPAAEWKRITFLYTTGERLLAAETLNDLTVYDDERTLLWRALRERAIERQSYETADLPEFPIPPEILALLGMLGDGGEN
ncbi:MAG: hypothetical protein EPO32_02965 [Anaerolineae bacterium]|nr:MAG: hypothetical protein EPO32_02965 [Anaerolineae bacterium]